MADDVRTDVLRYPIGKPQMLDSLTDEQRQECIGQLESAPARLREAMRGLSPEQLDTPYREGGWTIRQIVHHLAESHMNAYIRVKLGLTEDEPIVKTYEEASWARTAEALTGPVDMSLNLFEALHQRFVMLLRSLSNADFQRKFRHPHLGLMSIDKSIGLYSWHGRHHTAHITEARKRNGW